MSFAVAPVLDEQQPSVDVSRGPGSGPWRAFRGYFRSLWSGTEPLHRLIISDMLIGGTLINVAAMAAAFGLFALAAPRWLGIAVFLSPVPYNLFLVVTVWRTADRSGSAWAWPAKGLAIAWMLAMLMV